MVVTIVTFTGNGVSDSASKAIGDALIVNSSLTELELMRILFYGD